jgi:hypothetical protein
LPAVSGASAFSLTCEQVVAEVRARTPVDERERECIEQFLAQFEQLGDPFSEHAGPIHVTGSALVVGARGVSCCTVTESSARG